MIDGNNPLVSIVILTYNRKEELRNTLNKSIDQNYKNIEIIVVDNNSIDGTCVMISKEFPNVIYIKLEKNIGAPGYNYGFNSATGEYILVLDDDSYPDKNTIMAGLEYFNNNKLGIIAYNIFNTRCNISETANFNSKPYLFIGCGALLSKKALANVGNYNNLYFLYNNELDLSARFYDAGYNILYLDNVFVYHNQSPLMRDENNQKNPNTTSQKYYYNFLNFMIFLYQNFSIKYVLVYSPKWIFNRFLVAVKASYYIWFLRAIGKFIKLLPKILKQRRTLTKQTQKFYNNGNVPIFDRDFFLSKD